MKKDAEHIAVYTVRATTPINGFKYIVSEVAVPSFPSYRCSKHFRKYRRKSHYVSNDLLGKLYL